MTALQYLADRNHRARQHGSEFKMRFGVSLHQFWPPLEASFDLIKFDDWLGTPDGTSTKEFLLEHKGQAAVDLIEQLISI